jgi:hypothetical protein
MAVEPMHLAGDVLPNLRDVGGLATDTGGYTRSGVLLRSAAPLADDRAPALPGWPPALVLDLRGIDELRGRPHPLIAEGSVVHSLPLLKRRLMDAKGRMDWSAIPDLGSAYLEFMAVGGPTILRIAELLVESPGPALVHCTAGKDRTGVVVAVLLRAVGVSRAELLRDYRATEPALPAILARTPPELTQDVDPTALERLMGVPAEAMITVLDELDNSEGGAAGWLAARGVTAPLLNAWRERILQ